MPVKGTFKFLLGSYHRAQRISTFKTLSTVTREVLSPGDSEHEVV